VSPRPSRSERSRRPRCRDARFAFASPRAVRRRAFLSRARGRCYRQADSSSGTAAARDREFKKKDGALAVCEKDKRRDWLKKPEGGESRRLEIVRATSTSPSGRKEGEILYGAASSRTSPRAHVPRRAPRTWRLS
jgi:hypothetical protein